LAKRQGLSLVVSHRPAVRAHPFDGRATNPERRACIEGNSGSVRHDSPFINGKTTATYGALFECRCLGIEPADEVSDLGRKRELGEARLSCFD
jgi:hypothetical protein